MPTSIRNRILLGMLTPSSNTILEPVTTRMISDIAEASVHFGRFKVTEIALSEQSLAQFDPTEILVGAELLSHAKVQSIGWSGTAAGWRGLLCARCGWSQPSTFLRYVHVKENNVCKSVGHGGHVDRQEENEPELWGRRPDGGTQ